MPYGETHAGFIPGEVHTDFIPLILILILKCISTSYPVKPTRASYPGKAFIGFIPR